VTVAAINLGISRHAIQVVDRLLKSECSIPFIARYRQDETGGLTPEQLRDVSKLLSSLRAAQERAQNLISKHSFDKQLCDALLSCHSVRAINELYAPMKTTKKSAVEVARFMGYQKLADLILSGGTVRFSVIRREYGGRRP
jgi:uncharacterized protein